MRWGCLVGAVVRVRVELRRCCEAWVQGWASERRAVFRALLKEDVRGRVVQLVLDGLCERLKDFRIWRLERMQFS